MVETSIILLLRDNKLYNKGYSLLMLRCLISVEVEYVMKEIHEGICGNHFGARSLCHKII